MKTARQVFAAAIKWKMLSENPLSDTRTGSQSNRARMHFVSREDVDRVMEACPDAQWRLIVALARYGGLRCPSEVFAVRPVDIDWKRKRLTVWSCKTEHNPGGDRRQIPIFDELVQPLLDAMETMPPDAEHLIWRYRGNSTNLRTEFLRIIERAGLQPWPKVFQNMRSTRQTELMEIHPTQTVCAWLGNSEKIALSHYAQIRDEHFEAAAAKDDLVARASAAAARVTQKAAQQASERPRKASQAGCSEVAQVAILQSVANACETVRMSEVTPAGSEQSAKSPEKAGVSPSSDAKSDARCARDPNPPGRDPNSVIPVNPTPQDLEAIVAAVVRQTLAALAAARGDGAADRPDRPDRPTGASG